MKRFSRARKNKQLMAGSVLAIIIVTIAIIGPIVFGDYDAQNLALSHKPVGTDGAFFGTDGLGRNLAARATFGIRISLLVAIAVTAIAVVCGTIIGLVAGYTKGVIDSVASLIIDFI